MLIKLTATDGTPIAVDPQEIIMVKPLIDGTGTVITFRRGLTWQAVQEKIGTVIKRVNSPWLC